MQYKAFDAFKAGMPATQNDKAAAPIESKQIKRQLRAVMDQYIPHCAESPGVAEDIIEVIGFKESYHSVGWER